MVELALRVLGALTIFAAGWFAERPSFEAAWRIGALWSAVAIVAWLLERRGMLDAGPSGWIAVAEAGLIAWALADAGWLPQLGLLALLPCAWAARRSQASGVTMAPLAASSLLIAENAHGGWAFAPAPLAQAAAILAVGLALGTRASAAVAAVPEARPTPEEKPVTLGVEPEKLLTLRESYRRLRDHCESLEKGRKVDRLQLRLLDASRTASPIPELAHAIREALGVDGASLFTLAENRETLVVRASSGKAVNPQTQFHVPHLTHLASRLSSALRTNGSAPTATVALRDKGRLIGMVCLHDAQAERLRRAEALLEGAAPFLARTLRELDDREREVRRLVVAELLYEVATVGAGAETPTTLAARVVRELWPTLALDHVGIWLLDDASAFAAATEGAGTRVMDALTFATGEGLAAWLTAGAPETYALDAHQDGSMARNVALSRRIGSFLVLPIQFGPNPFGFFVATTHRVGGVDRSVRESLHVVCSELSQALARLTRAQVGPEGLASPVEFQRALAAQPAGCFLVLEPLDLDGSLERFGAPSVDLALHRLGVRLRGMLPAGALLCRRPERDFVAFLPDVDLEFARRWANDAAAAAALVPLTTPDGRMRIPLGLRARATRLDHPATQEVLLQNAG